ncbi:hypothetical protein SeMB42_g05155 [Synchytrium endobioticum]|uniref:Enoyl reductase (ER) domain-containing protein n=1 Tax=Synchytrium endobioticum TaxID=286115 RepID=A0A507CBR1_9FUNG|nr:hypothetical protein SeLEV6574_g08298 [Synchytrium endobioticum]TPX34983.1 hypothetical protein SeLEV6574_g08223 [Synchytrium endobioticum]TPX42348.1 hypothetical protein SeMB42_g05155 [Synchytrium endobioticum]
MTVQNTRVLFTHAPTGWPQSSDFTVDKTQLDLELPLSDGQLLVKTLYLSLDPYMRGRMNVDKASYIAPWKLNEPASGGTILEVIRSTDPKFTKGDILVSRSTWESYAVVASSSCQKIHPDGIPLSYYVGVLGMPGLTAYVGLRIGKPKEGETIYISAASGAVGQIVGQLAKMKGLRVVGSAGSDAKVAYLRDLGFEAFNYKTMEHEDAMRKYCPNGIDIYFENVGGATLDNVLVHMNNHGRIPLCGMISQYNSSPETAYGVKNLMLAVGKRLELTGFIVSDHLADSKQFLNEMTQWIREKRITYKEDVVEGLEKAPEALIGVLKGENFGKRVVKVEISGT